MKDKTAPEWLKTLKQQGFEPYVATSKIVAPALDLSPFGEEMSTHFMEDTEEGSFLEAYMFLETYLLSNSLGFQSPGLKMPMWVLIDCVLMQTAVVGFTAPIEVIPESVLEHYRKDPAIDLSKLKRLPISGQICASNMGGNSMTGISLFSLGSSLKNNPGKLGFYTKMLAMETYRARDYATYYGIAQYNNAALKVHGKFGRELEIYQPTVMLHTCKDMTFIYKMKAAYDPYDFKPPAALEAPSFWMSANDLDKKREMQEGIRRGKRYIICPPYSTKHDNTVYLPILEKGE